MVLYSFGFYSKNQYLPCLGILQSKNQAGSFIEVAGKSFSIVLCKSSTNFSPPLSSFTHYLLKNNMKYQVEYNSSHSFRPSKFDDSMHMFIIIKFNGDQCLPQ